MKDEFYLFSNASYCKIITFNYSYIEYSMKLYFHRFNISNLLKQYMAKYSELHYFLSIKYLIAVSPIPLAHVALHSQANTLNHIAPKCQQPILTPFLIIQCQYGSINSIAAKCAHAQNQIIVLIIWRMNGPCWLNLKAIFQSASSIEPHFRYNCGCTLIVTKSIKSCWPYENKTC